MIEITNELCADLRKRAERATHGPWKWDDDEAALLVGAERDDNGEPIAVVNDPNVFHWRNGDHDKAFIAAANPAVVLALLERIAALEARRTGDVAAVDAERRATYAEALLKRAHNDLSALAEEIAYLKQVRQARDTECAALRKRVEALEMGEDL